MPRPPEEDERANATRRLDRLRAAMSEMQLTAYLCLDPGNQTYLSGFSALVYSRPIMLLIEQSATTLIVPALEEDHARSTAAIDDVRVYHERPGAPGAVSSSECLTGMLATFPRCSRIGVESNSCPVTLERQICGAGHELADADEILTGMRRRKDASEIALLRDAGRVVNAAVAASIDAVRIGATELDVDQAGNARASAMAAAGGAETKLEHLVMTPSGVERTALPHVFSTTRALAAGDVLIQSRQVALANYHAELERTLFVGKPTNDQVRIFDVMRSAQEAAIAAINAGVRCCDVDRAARAIIDKAALGSYALHRTGHGIGLSVHEPPYLRFDSSEILDEGMAITVEPGIYVPGVGGFRHSDTMIVTHDGVELITSYPSDLASLSRFV